MEAIMLSLKKSRVSFLFPWLASDITNATIFLSGLPVESTELHYASNIAFYEIYEKHVRPKFV